MKFFEMNFALLRHMLIGLLLLAFGLLFVSCEKKYWLTAKVCHDSLYVETFRINPAGEYSTYLTDSTHFRVFMGIFDPEEDAYTYSCNGDSIVVEKHTLGYKSSDRISKTLSKEVYSLRELKKEHRLD
jgi:hypothetical protein